MSENIDSQKSPSKYGNELKRRNTRRASFKDYTRPGFYMITVTARSGISPFCDVSGSAEQPRIEYSPLGEIILRKIETIPEYTPQLKIVTSVVMPDHFHLLLQVCAPLSRHLGRIIGSFMGGCTSMARKSGLIGSAESLFKEKFHDRVVSKIGQIDTLRKYIADNPRRFLIKRMHPDIFRKYLHIKLGEREYAAYGNIFLLKYDDILAIRIHRKWSASEFESYERECFRRIDSGAVVIGPFVHHAEKNIRDRAKKMGKGVIVIREKGFEERFKPQGEEFELCAEGRLLLLAPWPDNTLRSSRAGSREFHAMNDMA